MNWNWKTHALGHLVFAFGAPVIGILCIMIAMDILNYTRHGIVPVFLIVIACVIVGVIVVSVLVRKKRKSQQE